MGGSMGLGMKLLRLPCLLSSLRSGACPGLLESTQLLLNGAAEHPPAGGSSPGGWLGSFKQFLYAPLTPSLSTQSLLLRYTSILPSPWNVLSSPRVRV